MVFNKFDTGRKVFSRGVHLKGGGVPRRYSHSAGNARAYILGLALHKYKNVLKALK